MKSFKPKDPDRPEVHPLPSGHFNHVSKRFIFFHFLSSPGISYEPDVGYYGQLVSGFIVTFQSFQIIFTLVLGKFS